MLSFERGSSEVDWITDSTHIYHGCPAQGLEIIGKSWDFSEFTVYIKEPHPNDYSTARQRLPLRSSNQWRCVQFMDQDVARKIIETTIHKKRHYCPGGLQDIPTSLRR